MKIICETLKEYAVKMIIFKMKKMKWLTIEQQEFYEYKSINLLYL